MRSDYHATIRELEGAIGDLGAVGLLPETEFVEPTPDYLSAVHRGLLAIFSSPIASAAFVAEENRRSRTSPSATAPCDSLIASIAAAIEEISDWTRLIQNDWRLLRDRDPSAWDKLATISSWQGGRTPREQILRQFLAPKVPTNLSMNDLDVLRKEVLLAVAHTIDHHEVKAVATRLGMWDDMQAKIKRACDELANGARLIDLSLEHWRRGGREEFEYFRALHQNLSELSNGNIAFPRPVEDPLNDLQEALPATGVRDRLTVLLNLIVRRLGDQPVRRHAIARLRTYLERFARKRIMVEITSASARGDARTPEQHLQDEVDAFLFHEGFFPITHAVAGRGRIDTFFEAHRHAFSDPTLDAQLPILLELKQVLRAGSKSRSSTTRSKVAKAVDDAIVQADQYRGHLAANFKWLDQDVFAIVAYDGPTRYTTDRSDVVLVYLGDALPSDKAKPL